MNLERWCLWYKRRGAGRLRRILMREWDPIGVAGAPEARDEYDAYVGQIAEMLRLDAPDEVIAARLESIRHDRMGLPPDRKTDLRVAATIREWYSVETGAPDVP